MSNPTDPSADVADDRLTGFEAELARLRVSGTSSTTEQRLLVAGIVLMPVGLVLVLIGWFGASGTTEFSSQVPYLISGGLLGLGCTIVGAVLYLRHSLARYLRFWLLRVVYEERTSSDRNVEALHELGQILRNRAPTDPSAVPPREKETQP
ncbi:MAG: hypothetical protein U5K30_08525 [Acidimicrobiales bacterium]|nr:hypothetical protein [Acidimicrobiales bacterium]